MATRVPALIQLGDPRVAAQLVLKKTIRAAKYMYYESTFSRNKNQYQEHMENHK